MLQGLVGGIGHAGITADVFQIGADETERLFFVLSLDRVDPFDAFFVGQGASQAIDRVGRVNNEPALPEDLDCLFNQPHLGILAVYGN